MALILFDDFRGYTLAQIDRAWTSHSGSGLSIASSGGRFGTDPYLIIPQVQPTLHYIQKSFPTTSTLVVGCALRMTDPITAGTQTIVTLWDGSNEQCRLVMESDHKFRVQRGIGTNVTGGTSVNAISLNVWYYVEWKVTIANSIGANTCQVNVDEVNWLDVDAGQDLQLHSTSNLTQVRFGTTQATSGTFNYGHVYIDNGIAFYGDSRVETLVVVADGTTLDFTSSSGIHFQDTDDVTPDDDATYVESATPGDVETFEMSDLSASPATIHAIAVWNCMRKTDGGSRTAAAVVRSGTTNYVQANVAVSDGYFYHPTILTQDPDTAAPWTVSGVNAHEAGLKVIA